MVCRHYLVYGKVQGVGYRDFAKGAADKLGIAGWVKNLIDGNVECMAVGDKDTLQEFESSLKQGPILSRVDDIEVTEASAPDALSGFEIRY